MNQLRFCAVALLPLLLAGCTQAKIDFTRAERINVSSDQSRGLPLEIAIVAVTSEDVQRSPQLDPDRLAINSLEWFRTAEQNIGSTPFGLPSSQIWYFAASKPFGRQLGPELPGYAAGGGDRPQHVDIDLSTGFFSSYAGLFVFARYQDANLALRATQPIVIRKPGNYRVHVGGTELRLE